MNNIEEKIKNMKFPLITLYYIFCNNDINDNTKSIVLKCFFKYHMNIAIEYNLLTFKNILTDYPLTYNNIIDIYNIISRQLSILPYLFKFKRIYKNNIFWKKNILDQIIYLKQLHITFLSIFDGSKGMLYFHLKLKSIEKPNNYHIEEIILRLKKTFNIFKKDFFDKNNIIILDNHQFMDLKFSHMVKYTEYIFLKINGIIKQTITYFQLYENYRQQLYNILNITNTFNIDIIDVNSDLDTEDMQFMTL